MCLFRRVFELESGLIKTVSGAQIVRNIWRSWIEETSWSLRNLCLATLNTHALKETQHPSLTYFRGQRSGSGVACFTCLTPWPPGSIFYTDSDRLWNPKPLLSVLYVSTTNHQQSFSTQLVDPFTSAAEIWDTISLSCDTLYVSNCSLVYFGG